jgi:hypothetical protein
MNCLWLILVAAPQAAGESAPPDLAGRVVSVFADDPMTLMMVAPRVAFQGSIGPGTAVYVRPETRVTYVDIPREERRPAVGLFASVWLRKDARDEAARVEFRREEARRADMPERPRVPGGPVTLEAELLSLEGGEVRDLDGAGGGKAVYFARHGMRARGEVLLDRGLYEFTVHLQGPSEDRDAVYVAVDHQEYRFYQDLWGRLAPGKVLLARQALFEISRDGRHEMIVEAAESGVYIDRIVISRLERAGGGLDPFRPDREGFIRDWLVLGPVPAAPGKDGAQEIETCQLEDEARLRPREGQALKVRDRFLVWRRHRAAGPCVDIRDFALSEGARAEDAVAYAVCSAWAEEELRNLELRMGSNDQAKVYLNGGEVLKHTRTRTLRPDESVARGVSLKKGENLIVFKVVNEKNDWGGCLRFVRPDGQPVRDLRIGIPLPRADSGGGR